MALFLRTHRRGRFTAALAAAGVAALGLAACAVDEGGDPQRTRAEQEERIEPVFSVEDGEENVDVLDPVRVSVDAAAGEALEEVVMTNEEGREVEGELAEGGAAWASTEPLGYGRTYTVAATVDGDTVQRSFTTVVPDIQANVSVAPAEGAVVGVGQTIAVRFGVPVADRVAAQDMIEVIADPPVEGAFFWLSDYEVRWRPAEFWDPGTAVQVKVNAYGRELGDNDYGAADAATSFTIGDRVVAVADDATKTMTIERNGEAEMSMPISMGNDRWLTPNGVYIIGEQHEDMVMDSTTYGLSLEDGGYKTPVKYATQMSYSGIYVHGAPWSVWAQGSQNTSHGCINVSIPNAKWFQEHTKRGDVVIVKNTKGEVLSGYDGLGDWNIPWERWKAGNADRSDQ
ncbi:L,D-transpeptidase [Corynebacterium sphenisci]|uniref:L,D-transpeptidase n=1 Tax=Corynebacterium sphenisci TaxID=191493 RepID=UPI0026DF36BE|nr:Ig-like domain-containing protein [Corynebacterium sphenisci]MDO5730281.1 Ig-like domain-containing protein [Corynebacterium sphenisci]